MADAGGRGRRKAAGSRAGKTRTNKAGEQVPVKQAWLAEEIEVALGYQGALQPIYHQLRDAIRTHCFQMDPVPTAWSHLGITEKEGLVNIFRRHPLLSHISPTLNGPLPDDTNPTFHQKRDDKQRALEALKQLLMDCIRHLKGKKRKDVDAANAQRDHIQDRLLAAPDTEKAAYRIALDDAQISKRTKIGVEEVLEDFEAKIKAFSTGTAIYKDAKSLTSPPVVIYILLAKPETIYSGEIPSATARDFRQIDWFSSRSVLRFPLTLDATNFGKLRTLMDNFLLSNEEFRHLYGCTTEYSDDWYDNLVVPAGGFRLPQTVQISDTASLSTWLRLSVRHTQRYILGVLYRETDNDTPPPPRFPYIESTMESHAP